MRDQGHSMSSTKPKATDEIASRIFLLPLELQIEIVNNISGYSDLKALCLVSKGASGIATPRLFYRVELKDNRGSNEKMAHRISSLLVRPENLRFVRVLKTPPLDLKSTRLMSRILPLLRDDYLTEFSFATISIVQFPTPRQMSLLCSRQKTLQNLTLYARSALMLAQSGTESEPRKGALLDFFSNHIDRIINAPHGITLWPFMNLDLRILQSLQFCGRNFPRLLMFELNELFANGSFVNITNLKFSYIMFHRTLTLINVPSLRRLAFEICELCDHSLPLVLTDGLMLPNLSYSSCGKMEQLIPFLTQIKGLESLLIVFCPKMEQTSQAIGDLAHAINLHKETLRTLELSGDLHLELMRLQRNRTLLETC